MVQLLPPRNRLLSTSDWGADQVDVRAVRHEDLDGSHGVGPVLLVVRGAVEVVTLHTRCQVVAAELELDRSGVVLRLDLSHSLQPVADRGPAKCVIGMGHVPRLMY